MKKSKRRLEWHVDCMCDVYTCFLVSSSERERDVGRINEKQHSLADLIQYLTSSLGNTLYPTLNSYCHNNIVFTVCITMHPNINNA